MGLVVRRGLFLLRISEKLTPYRFHLIPNPTEDVRGNGRPNIGRIEISRGSARSILQTIEVQSYADASWSTQSFRAEDINFDGYLDISVLDDHGAICGASTIGNTTSARVILL